MKLKLTQTAYLVTKGNFIGWVKFLISRILPLASLIFRFFTDGKPKKSEEAIQILLKKTEVLKPQILWLYSCMAGRKSYSTIQFIKKFKKKFPDTPVLLLVPEAMNQATTEEKKKGNAKIFSREDNQFLDGISFDGNNPKEIIQIVDNFCNSRQVSIDKILIAIDDAHMCGISLQENLEELHQCAKNLYQVLKELGSKTTLYVNSLDLTWKNTYFTTVEYIQKLRPFKIWQVEACCSIHGCKRKATTTHRLPEAGSAQFVPEKQEDRNVDQQIYFAVCWSCFYTLFMCSIEELGPNQKFYQLDGDPPKVYPVSVST